MVYILHPHLLIQSLSTVLSLLFSTLPVFLFLSFILCLSLFLFILRHLFLFQETSLFYLSFVSQSLYFGLFFPQTASYFRLVSYLSSLSLPLFRITFFSPILPFFLPGLSIFVLDLTFALFVFFTSSPLLRYPPPSSSVVYLFSPPSLSSTRNVEAPRRRVAVVLANPPQQLSIRFSFVRELYRKRDEEGEGKLRRRRWRREKEITSR